MSLHVTSSSTVVAETGSLTLPRIGYENLARDASISASSEESNFPADAAARPDTYECWKPGALSATWRADLATAQAVNYVGIAAHDLGTCGCNLIVQYSSNDSTWLAASDFAVPTDDSPILLLFPGQTARYWRLLINGVGSPTTSSRPSIASIYMGSILTMQRQFYGGHTPIALSRDTGLQTSMSRGGHFLGQSIRRNGFVGNVSFRHLTASWVRSTFKPFADAARQFPYFFAWRPGSFTDEVAYAWTDEDIRPSNMGVQAFMQVSWRLRAFGDE